MISSSFRPRSELPSRWHRRHQEHLPPLALPPTQQHPLPPETHFRRYQSMGCRSLWPPCIRSQKRAPYRDVPLPRRPDEKLLYHLRPGAERGPVSNLRRIFMALVMAEVR